jgi:antibiotic biosynthesis monooxygenase (ABM) superfamily enzyme
MSFGNLLQTETSMTTINENNVICTLINVFTVDPDKHAELFELLKDATENVMSRMPGYISANIHISDDKKTITNYAQWASLEDFQNMLQNPEAREHMTKAAVIAREYRPVTYNKIWTHSRRIVHI